MDPEEKDACSWELEMLQLNSLLDLLRLAAASNSITVLLEFESPSLRRRVIGTFANNYGATKPDIFSYVLWNGDEEGSFIVYKADETGEQYSFSNSISTTGGMTFPIVRLPEEPRWFAERSSHD